MEKEKTFLDCGLVYESRDFIVEWHHVFGDCLVSQSLVTCKVCGEV